VPIARFLRVVVFHAGSSETPVDALLREAIVPRLLERDEILDAWIGRHGSRTDQSRVLASTWCVEPGPAPADLELLGQPGLPDGASVVDSVDEIELAIHARFNRSEPARVLRVFRGRVKPGELDDYVGQARSGMAADSEVNDGLIAFALATEPPDSFITVSAWTGWPAIEAATGGNTRRPGATRNAGRLADFSVAHYEILPETPDRRGATEPPDERGT
jgi:hypothetical protein